LNKKKNLQDLKDHSVILHSAMFYGTVGERTKALDQNQARIKFQLKKLCSRFWFSKLLILNYH